MTETLSGVARGEAADRLKAELREYLAAQATRLLTGAGQKLGQATVKLTDIAEGNSPGFAQPWTAAASSPRARGPCAARWSSAPPAPRTT